MNSIGLTMGDPAGVGPELIIRLLEQLDPEKSPPLILIGDDAILNRALDQFGGKKARAWFNTAEIWDPARAPSPAPLIILSRTNLSPRKIPLERAGKKYGKASWEYIETAVKLCQEKICSGIVTLPVNKSAMLKAGCPCPGHTDLLARLDEKKRAVMMMVLGKLRVALLTHHLPLRDVPRKIEKTKIVSILKIMDQALKTDFRIKNPGIGILGLNPHSGEGGRIGDEEIKILGPAIKQAQSRGINARGPISGDTAFTRAKTGEFDALLALYHDQGIAPIKALGFERVVNVTLGLSFVRTSPGHGTAYDIAWQGKADPTGLLEAFKLAQRLIKNREPNYAGK